MFWGYLTGDDDSRYVILRDDKRHIEEFFLLITSPVIVSDIICGMYSRGDLFWVDFRDVACIMDCEHGL